MTKDKRCVVCGKPQDEKYKPFCSSRCAQVDLGKWLGEAYALPSHNDLLYEVIPVEEE